MTKKFLQNQNNGMYHIPAEADSVKPLCGVHMTNVGIRWLAATQWVNIPWGESCYNCTWSRGGNAYVKVKQVKQWAWA